MAVVSGNEFGAMVINALGLPKHTRWFELRCAVGEKVKIKCKYFPDELDVGEDGKLITVLKEYELHEKI